VRFHAQSALLFLLLCLTSNPAMVAQTDQEGSNGNHPGPRENPERRQGRIGSRSLTLGESLAILGAALDSRHHGDIDSDCSHFVHGLYQQAGFPYEYASSSELYVGIDQFRRVNSPQPGDLAVWRGHVGVVINPVQHSFFSLLRSGPGVDSYESPYWKERGRPHFFRYVKAVSSDVLSNSTRTVRLKPVNTESREPTATDRGPGGSEESSRETVASANPPMGTANPGVTVVQSVHPKTEEVGAAFLQACANSEGSLRERDVFKLTQSLVVFDRIEVRKVHLKGNQNWAEIEIDQLASLSGSKAEVHRRSERQRWPLSRRDDTSWELTPSQDTIYLPQDAAVRLLAHELAQLTEGSSDTPNRTQAKAELARLLNVLLGR